MVNLITKTLHNPNMSFIHICSLLVTIYIVHFSITSFLYQRQRGTLSISCPQFFVTFSQIFKILLTTLLLHAIDLGNSLGQKWWYNPFPSLVPRPLPDFHSSKIQSESGLGTRLPLFYISDHKTDSNIFVFHVLVHVLFGFYKLLLSFQQERECRLLYTNLGK